MSISRAPLRNPRNKRDPATSTATITENSSSADQAAEYPVGRGSHICCNMRDIVRINICHDSGHGRPFRVAAFAPVFFPERSQFVGQTNFIKASTQTDSTPSPPSETLPCSAARVFANACNFIETRSGEIVGERVTRNPRDPLSIRSTRFSDGATIFYVRDILS